MVMVRLNADDGLMDWGVRLVYSGNYGRGQTFLLIYSYSKEKILNNFVHYLITSLVINLCALHIATLTRYLFLTLKYCTFTEQPFSFRDPSSPRHRSTFETM